MRQEKREVTKTRVSTDTRSSFCSAQGNQSKLIRENMAPNSLCSSYTNKHTHIRLPQHISRPHLIMDIMLRDKCNGTNSRLLKLQYSFNNSFTSPIFYFILWPFCLSVRICVNSLFFCRPSVSLSVAPPQHHLQRVFDITCAICSHTHTHKRTAPYERFLFIHEKLQTVPALTY